VGEGDHPKGDGRGTSCDASCDADALSTVLCTVPLPRSRGGVQSDLILAAQLRASS